MATASPRDLNGLPDFKYVATHICRLGQATLESRRRWRRLTRGIRYRSFELLDRGRHAHDDFFRCRSAVYQMVMSKGDPRYIVKLRRVLFAERGTELKIGPLLEGIRGLSGEKIQWYLASELRDRIRNTQVRVTVIDNLRASSTRSSRDSSKAACSTTADDSVAVRRGVCRIVSYGTGRGVPGRPYPRWHAGDR